MSVTLLWVLVVGMVFSALCLIIHDRRRVQLERFRMIKMSGEKLFQDIQSILRHSKRRKLEVLEIHADYILFKYFQPDHWEERYMFTRHGYRSLSQTKMRTLAFLIRAENGELNDPGRYRLKRSVWYGISGQRLILYSFIIKPNYKDALSRMPSYAASIRENFIIRRND